MEAILEEECHRERKLREYEEGRAEVTRTLLSQLVLFSGLFAVVFIIIIVVVVVVVACLSYVICPILVCAVCYVVTKFVITCRLYFVYMCDSLSGAVTQLWKANVSFIKSVCPSVCLSA
jgi:uncharacterized membrane protein